MATLRNLESTLENRVVESAKKLGIKSIKLELRRDTGWPDRLFLIPGGRPVFIEFKRLGARPRPKQSFRLRQLEALGYAAIWVNNHDDAVVHLTRALAPSCRAKEGGEVSA